MKILVALVVSLGVLSAGARSLQLLTQTDVSFVPPLSGGGDSMLPVLSADGRFVLFASTANNLVLATNNQPLQVTLATSLNVYLRDRASNTTALVSGNLTGTGGGDRDALPTGISANGQFALFESAAGNLAAGNTNNVSNVFVRDLVNGTTTLVSANTNGVSGNGDASSSEFTPDARYVVFTSAASNLVAGDTNGISDVFVRDRQSGTTRLVSVGAKSTGSAALPSTSDAPAITPDGRYVAFYSSATNLVAGVKVAGEVYVRDLVANNTIWASAQARSLFKSVTGTTNAVSCSLSLSADGNYVAFETCTNPPSSFPSQSIVLRYSLATGFTDLVHTNTCGPTGRFEEIQNLNMTGDGRFIAYVANVRGTTGTNTAIFVWDAQTGTNTLVSANTNNAPSAAGECDSPVISSNGQLVAFVSTASDLTTNVLADGYHLYLRSVADRTTSLLDVDINGAGSGTEFLTAPVLTADGQSIAFDSRQGNLTPADYNHAYDVFLRNPVAGTTELISTRHPLLPSLTPNGVSSISAQAVSQDGRYLAFASAADTLVPGDTNQLPDVFVRDLYTGTNRLASVASGAGGTGSSFDPAISGDGRTVAFSSFATNFFAGDTNNASDVFVRDLQTQTTFLISANTTGTGGGNKDSDSPTISADGRFVLFVSKAGNLAAGSFSGTENLFLRDRQAGTTRALTTSGLACAAMTPDGRFIAFTDIAGSSSGKIYVWNALLASRVATNSTPLGIVAVAISPDGNRIARFAFSGTPSLSVWDRAANQVSVIGSGFLSAHSGLRFSADSRFLAYAAAPSANGTSQASLYDFQAQTNRLVSHAAGSAAAGNGSSDSPDVSADGRFVIYRSAAGNIVAGDTNGVPDVFLYDTTTGTNTILSAGGFGAVAANNRSLTPFFSGDGRMLVFCSWGSDLMAGGDYNQSSDLFALAFLYAALAAPNGGSPTISWPVSPGQTYSVQYKDNLNDANWQPVSGTVTISGNRGYLTDTAANAGQRFYRVSGN